MNNKVNILEELNKMKNLINAKAGTVISEQSNVTDKNTYPACVRKVGSISQTAREVFIQATGIYTGYKFYNNGRYLFGNKKGSYSCSGDEILIDGRKLTTKAVTYPLCVTNNRWGEPVTKGGVTYIPGGKKGEIDFTGYKFFNNNRVATPTGKVVSYACSSDNSIISIESDASANIKKTSSDNWKTKFPCVSTQPGAKPVKLKDGTIAYRISNVIYYSSGRKKLADGTMSNYNCKTEFKGGTGTKDTGTKDTGTKDTGTKQGVQSVANKFSQSAKSLGIQNGNMDVQTLQNILNKLQSDTPIETTTQKTPDMAQLTAMLNQLNA